MSYKFDSMVIILNKLNTSEKVTIASLIDEFEVSSRTIFRYMKTLMSAFPINFDREKGYYTFEEGYSLKKVKLSPEEALALCLAKDLCKSYGSGMEQALCSVEQKIRSDKAA